jgi:predicted nucleic acid-binding protein
MILVDSSIWVDHFRLANPILDDLLSRKQVLSHPFVIGELALGSLKDRSAVISDLSELPRSQATDEEEVLSLIERFKIFARGIGYVDAHLLTSVRLTPEASLWTRDRRLRAVAEELGVAADLPGMSVQ